MSDQQQIANNTADLDTPSPDTILDYLEARYHANFLYTNVGSRSIVAVNPFQPVQQCSEATAKQYAKNVVSLSNKRLGNAHIFNLAASAYLHMTRFKKDQIIILRYVIASFLNSG